MQELIMLIGLVASGKSTVAEEYKSKGYKIHSSDALREELLGNVNDQKGNDIVFKELFKRCRDDIKSGHSVVFDATNLVSKKRVSSLNQIKTKELEGVVFSTVAELIMCPYNECIDRNRKRDRKVPQEVIERMYKSFQVPVLGEGFDEIRVRYTSNIKFNVTKQLDKLKSIWQYNQNHTLTIGDHCERVAYQLTQEENLFRAGLLHDFGKMFTGRFMDSHGRVSEDKHYYSHESVSAYDSFFYWRDVINDNDRLEVAQLINYHMLPHVLKTDKSINKRLRLFGEEMWSNILKLHEADKKGR